VVEGQGADEEIPASVSARQRRQRANPVIGRQQMQYVPAVSDEDVERVVRRDYPAEIHSVIHQLLRSVDVREKPRVILACLKNAGGNVEKLKAELTNADGDWREIIGEAEYPNYTKKMFRIDGLSTEERERIIEKDKRQYLEWLNGDCPAGRPKREHR
jgi:hypothetical protein